MTRVVFACVHTRSFQIGRLLHSMADGSKPAVSAGTQPGDGPRRSSPS